MSNYIYGFFTNDDRMVAPNIAEAMRRQSILGFHLIDLDDIPDFRDFPRSADLVYFILSDHYETLRYEDLMLEQDWAINYTGTLSQKLTDRVSLIVSAVKIIAEHSKSTKIGLWLSEVDQLEGVVEVPFASLFETIVSDFEKRGFPCLLYEVVP